MTEVLSTALVTSTAIGSLGDEFLERITASSPLTPVVLDLMHAAATDATVPAPPAEVPDAQQAALRHLCDPEFQVVVVYRSGLTSASFTVYTDHGTAVRFDPEGGYLYSLSEAVDVARMAAFVADQLPPPSAGAAPREPVSLGDAAYFAALGWVASYRDQWLPAGLAPGDAVVTVDDVREGLSSDSVSEMLAVVTSLGAPASFADAYTRAVPSGVDDLRSAGLVADEAGGLVLTETGRSLLGPLAFPAVSLSLLAVRLTDNAGACAVVLSEAESRATAVVTPRVANGAWVFELASVDPDGILRAVQDGLAPTPTMPTPLVDGPSEWPSPLLDTITRAG